jgi:class 3 adenylate cyclase/tetratricopeptide (TPR) repeat protein
MHCPSCGHPNSEGARFCAECATPFTVTVTCPSCGRAHPAATKYCDSCGHLLGDATPPNGPRDPGSYAAPVHLAAKIRASRGVLEGERKQITVLFADVIGSMALAERSDPEDWRGIMHRFFAVLCAGVHRFEGTVDKFTGDGIMALFGAPVAHEDHARRACYAALELQRELAAYAAELRRARGLSFAVRMGLNSGEVVVGAIGEDLAMEYTAIGHTVGLAQRMEQLASANRIYLSEHTASLVEGFLALTDLGEFQVKGTRRPLRVYELTGEGAARRPLDVSRARGFSRFVGREEEVHVLERALERAFAGDGQVIGIVGEAGVGKSRLCHEFAERGRSKGIPVYHVAGQAHTKYVPLVPVLQLLRAYFEIDEQDSHQTARERIATKLVLLDQSFVDDLPLIFDFLAVPDPTQPAPRMDPEARQRQLWGLMKRMTNAQSAREPGVTLVEDLHWLDPASETFLANQVEAVRGTRSLTVVNFRPEYHAPWMSKSHYRQIALAPLAPEAIELMIVDLLGSGPSLHGLSELIHERTEGNPFFIEELVQSLVEAGRLVGERGDYRLAAPVEEAAVPPSVQAVLAARIDRLGRRDKAVLQAAAVVGKEFSVSVLERVIEVAPQQLEEVLGNLFAGEFIYQQELYPEALCAFKHPLTQQVAYGSQLAESRTPVHAAVARAIAELYPERLDERAALVARHWEAAGETLEAARWHARAAAWAGYNDPTEALRHWRKVHRLADTLPESAETVALGLTARIWSLQFGWRLGISRKEAESLFTDAERMASQAGDIRSRALLLSIYGSVRGLGDGDVRAFARLVRQSFALAEESGDPALSLSIAPAAYACRCTGDYREGLAIFDRAIELADGDPTLGAGVSFGCPYALCHALKGFFLGELGELERGERLLEQGRKLAHEHGDIEGVGFGHMWSAWLAYFRGEPAAALDHAQQALAIAERIGDSFSRAYAWFCLGLAERMRGEWGRAIEALERSLVIATDGRTGVEMEAGRLAVLGESYLGLGDVDRARGLVAKAPKIAAARGHRSYETFANLALARALLGSAGPADRAEIAAALTRAHKLAPDTGAKAYEPMVHVELAELARQSGDQNGCEQELRVAHRMFTKIGATGHAQRLVGELATLAR